MDSREDDWVIEAGPERGVIAGLGRPRKDESMSKDGGDGLFSVFSGVNERGMFGSLVLYGAGVWLVL